MVGELTNYRTLVQQLLQKYADFVNRSRRDEISTFVVFDKDHDHYFVHTIGWRGLE
jgi:hypothetical protein